MPCRNAEATIRETIASLETQTLTAFETIAVDDASEDGTSQILDAWAERDPRVRVLRGHGQGIVSALRLATAEARAPLVGRMDADDIACPGRLAAQVSFLERHLAFAGCGTHVELFAAAGVGSGYRRYEDWINKVESPEDVDRNAFVECPIAHPTLVVRRSVLRAMGGYREVGWPEDYDLVLRILTAGGRLSNVPGPPLLRWRIHPGRLSLVSAAYDSDSFRRCKVHFLREAFLPPGRPVVVWGAGKVGKPLARELLGQGTEVAGFVDLDPRKIGQSIHGAEVVSPLGFEREPAFERAFVLAAVGSPGARSEISEALGRFGLKELTDFRFCA
jgi:glycosyltransferase involved in cell wall biosynthesis